MTEPFTAGVGAVLSADIAVPDHQREMRFYSRVLTTGATPLWRDDLMNSHGTPIIGLGARGVGHDKLPPQWMPHIQVADVAASTQRALDLGGSVLMNSKNNEWAVLSDLNGAAFGIVPVVSAQLIPSGGEADTPVGRLLWLDLTVSDANATRDFYQQVIGWSVQDVGMRDGDDRYADFNMLGQDGNPVAGVCNARGTNTGLPPVWMIYLPVGDLSESLRRVKEEGGNIIKTFESANGAYTFGAIQDPAGVYLALVPG